MVARWRPIRLLAGVLLFAACQDAAAPTPPTRAADVLRTPLVAQPATQDYIVVLRDTERDVVGTSTRLAALEGTGVKVHWEHALKGFLVKLTPGAAAAMARAPEVTLIEPDSRVTMTATQAPTPSWGLDRIDQRLGLDHSYTYNNTGAGVDAYIFDTGILWNHTEFVGRVGNGYSAFADNIGTSDCNGHGSHVAGIVGGTTYGVAKQVTLHPVRVLDCFGIGFASSVISGINWMITDATAPAVANMSLAGVANPVLDQAVANAVAAGIVLVVSSPNANADACFYSPARAASAITVNASDNLDNQLPYSGYGTCTDLFAPGASITSAYIGGRSAFAVATGTSQAAPHVAGAVALYLSANPGATTAQVAQALVGNATPNRIFNAGLGSPNRLLYMGFIGVAVLPPAPTAQRIAFTSWQN